jgi:2-keto-3-deoxy-L-rhamnonate aldolase RhmA
MFVALSDVRLLLIPREQLMNPSQLKRTLNKGGHVFGCMLSAMASSRFGPTLAGAGIDYAIVDAEHGSRDRAEIQALCAMLRTADVTPIVRVPVPKPEWVAMALDAGTAGVLVPYCEDVSEVEAVVATAKWHPMKGEYLRRAVRDNVFPSKETKKYLRNRRKDSFIIIGIESEPAYQNLDAILDVGDIDGVFVGPNDMSTSLGIPDDYANPKYLAVIEDIIKRCEARSIPVMVHQQTVSTSTAAIELGARFVLHSTESRMLQRIMQDEMNALRVVAGASGGASTDTVAID